MFSKIMLRNEGTPDRVLRVVAGLFLLWLVFLGPKTLWGILGLLPLLTGLVGSCPIYTLLGVSTCATSRPPVKTS